KTSFTIDTSEVLNVLGLSKSIFSTENFHLDIKAEFTESVDVIKDDDLLLELSFDEVMIEGSSIGIETTNYLNNPIMRLVIYKKYISFENMVNRTLISGSFMDKFSSEVIIQIRSSPEKDSIMVLFKLGKNDSEWKKLTEISLGPDCFFNKLRINKFYGLSDTESKKVSMNISGSVEVSTFSTLYTDSTLFSSSVNEGACKLLPLTYCEALDATISVKGSNSGGDDNSGLSLVGELNNVTLIVPKFGTLNSDGDLMYRWRLYNGELALYELSIFQTTIVVTNLINSETVSGPPMNLLSQYSENFSISLIFGSELIYIVDSGSNNIISTVKNVKGMEIDIIKTNYDAKSNIMYISSYSFTPGPKMTSSESNIINVFHQCQFFNQCSPGNYVCEGSSASRICEHPKILKLWYNGPLIHAESSGLGVFPESRSVFVIGSKTNNYFLINVFNSYLSLSDPVSGESCYNSLPDNEEITGSSTSAKFGVIITNSEKADLIYFSKTGVPNLLCSIELNREITDLYYFKSNGAGLSSIIGEITMNTEDSNTVLGGANSESLVILDKKEVSNLNILYPYISSTEMSLELSTELKENMGIHFDLQLSPKLSSSIVVGVVIENKYQNIKNNIYISGGSNPSVLLSSEIPGIGSISSSNSIPENCVSERNTLIDGGNLKFIVGIDTDKNEESVNISYLNVIICNINIVRVPIGGLNINKLVISDNFVTSSKTTLINGFYASRTANDQVETSISNNNSVSSSLSDYQKECVVDQRGAVISYCLSSSLSLITTADENLVMDPLRENYEVTLYFSIQNTTSFEYRNSYYYDGIAYKIEKLASYFILFNETHIGVVDLLNNQEIWNLYTGDALMGPSTWISVTINRISGFIYFALNDQIFANFPDYPSQSSSVSRIELVQSGSWSIFQVMKQDPEYESNRYPFMYNGYIECSFENNCVSSDAKSCVASSFSGLCPYPEPDTIAWLFTTYQNTPTEVNNGTYGTSFMLPNLVQAFKINDGFADIFAFYFFEDYAVVQSLYDGYICRNTYTNSNINIVTRESELNQVNSKLESISRGNFQWGFYMGDKKISLLVKINNNELKELCKLSIPENVITRLEIVYPVGYYSGIIHAEKKIKSELQITELPSEELNETEDPCKLRMFGRCHINQNVVISPEDTYFSSNYVFEFTFTYNSEKEYVITLSGISISKGENLRLESGSDVTIQNMEIKDLIIISVLGSNLQIRNDKTDIIVADITNIEPLESGTTQIKIFGYISQDQENFVLATDLNLDSSNSKSKLRNLLEEYKGVTVPLTGKISKISSRENDENNPYVYLSNWNIDTESLRPSTKHLVCMLDERPLHWCTGLVAQYTQVESDSNTIWFNFSISGKSQVVNEYQEFSYFDSYTFRIGEGVDSRRDLFTVYFGERKFMVVDKISAVENANNIFEAYYTNKTKLSESSLITMGVSVLNEVLLEVSSISISDMTGSITIVNSKDDIFTQFMLEDGIESLENVLTDGYTSCSFDSACDLETLSCKAQVLHLPCPRSTAGLNWLIVSKMVETKLPSE
ncbi:hypothetical protein FG379_000605, partial [Cryptosporidium bovis]|uniref:uncharacterized protein n=1 Tax=Cryptosporidium bovis TaxID=310047 RepID=UPI00351A6FFA